MSVEDNKRLVVEFNRHFGSSDIGAVLAMMAENSSWWVLGKPDLFPVTGTKTKAEFGAILRGIHASLDGGMKMEVVGMVAEGDYVAAELHALAATKTGKNYDNRYHMLYTIRDGRICAVREYTDLLNIKDVFY